MQESCICSEKERLGKLESNVNSIFKRIDEQLAITKAVFELTAEVRVMSERIAAITDSQKALRADIEDIKAAPRLRINDIVKALITALIGGLVVFALGQLGIKEII